MAKILILGGTGFTGRLIARHLLEHSTATVTVASRSLDKAKAVAGDLGWAQPERIAALRAEAGDAQSLHAALPGHAMVVVASPTTAQVETVAQAALDCGVDYLDVQLSAKKLAYLKSIAPQIEKAGRTFITEAGFHPGLPAALVRYAAQHLDVIESATLACYLSVPRDLPYSDAVEELIEIFKDYRAQIYIKGRWTTPNAWQMRKIDFGGDLGRRDCYSMFFEEMGPLPQMFPALRELGFFMAGTHWFSDWVVMPSAFALLKILPRATRTIGRYVWWGMTRFQKPPYRTELLIQTAGTHAGQPTSFETALSHRDAYEFTAIPVAAALLQYLNGAAKKSGLWMMGHLVEPHRLITDMKRMGVRLRTELR